MTIFKELKLLSNKLKNEGNKDHHNEARRLINLKYGKDWRDKLQIKELNKSKEYIKINYY